MSKSSHCCIAVIGALLTMATSAVGQEYSSLDQFLTAVAPAPVWQVVEGDLNGDGRVDRAVVTHQPNSEVSPKLHVLLQTSKGNFTLTSQAVAPNDHTGSVELTIRRGSLYVHLETIKPGNGQVTHQFKLHRGVWRLIGSTWLYPSTEAADPDGGRNFIKVDTNLLTGDSIETEINTRKVTRRRESTRAPCLLAVYDFDYGFCR